MALVEHQAARIYWDEEGSGEPILLIMGLGVTSHMWHRTRPVMAGRFWTLALDNRGVGRSDVPCGPYSTSLGVASNSLAIIWALNVASLVARVSAGLCCTLTFSVLATPLKIRLPPWAR